MIFTLWIWPLATPASDSEMEPIWSLAREFFPEAVTIGKFEGDPRAAPVFMNARLLGYVFLTDDVIKIPAYSGKPISALVGLDTQGVITGVSIVRHEEPILAVGLSGEDIKQFIQQYLGINIKDRIKIGGADRPGYIKVDGITGATITTMVLNASITRAASLVATSRGLPLSMQPMPWVDAGTAIGLPSPAVPATVEGAEVEPIWVNVWQERSMRIVVLGVGLVFLTAMLVVQDWLAVKPALLGQMRTWFLLYTLFFIGWYGLAQLSVINAFTFINALMGKFQWELFLIDPMMYILWSYVAITLLLWGRGVYCGWLCPFGALQELVSKLSAWIGLRQFQLPTLIHERLLAIKYIILVALFWLSLHSLEMMERFAEVEPFKTAVTLRFQREWQFVLYAVGLLVIAAFNRKFFCKYLCPLGAALAIPSHFRIFTWLRRRKECGHPCQICAEECPSQAIRPIGEYDMNECHYCLDCQVTYWNDERCPPLVRIRKQRERRAQSAEQKN
ncbi:MAG: 4Fe-4S binding protein [Gammaproteobacteria bacterium]|nr:4Fe-4S binding protein [Gammaproteobacteria bacterium]